MNTNIERFKKLKSYKNELIIEQKEKIRLLKERLALEKSPIRRESLSKGINDAIRVLKHHKNIVEFMRVEDNKQDKKHIVDKYTKIIKEKFPKNIPAVFHGTSFI